jgi:hypothetical protein
MGTNQPKPCINCGTESSSNFCFNCGQPMTVKRIRFTTMIRDAFEKFFGFDNMFVRTVWHGFSKPGLVAMTYIRGNRRAYIGPVGYFLIVTTIYLLYLNLVEVNMDDYYGLNDPDFYGKQDKQQVEVIKKITRTITKSTRAVSLINAMFFAFPLWAFFRKSGKINFTESLTAALYFSAQGIVLTILSVLSFSLTGNGFLIPVSIFNFLLGGWLTATMFTPKPSIANFIKGIVAGVLSSIVAAITGMILFAIAFAIFKESLFDFLGMPEFLESIKKKP